MPDEARVCITNHFIASVFRQCKVTLNNVNFSPYVSTKYAYKGFLDSIFFTTDYTQRCEPQGGMWIKDDYEWCKDRDPFTTSNTGLFADYGYCRDSKWFILKGKIFSDLF